jgi:cytochrome c-type biogenesis protein CcmH/NrfG
VGLLDELRALRDRDPDGFSAALAELGIAAQPAGGISGEWRGAGYALAIVALVAVLFNAAGDGSRDRRPGETMTGGDQVTSSNEPAAAPPADPRVAQARRRMETLQQQSSADPSNLDLLNQLTEAAMSAEDLAVAMEANTAALKIAPEDPESRVYKAVLQAFVGKRVEANATLDAVIASSPDHPKAYVYKGLLMMRTDPAGAIPLFEKALAIEDTPELRQALAQARMRAAGAPGGSATPPPAAGGADLIASGTITMGAEGASGTTLFVYVRQPGGAAGPPLGALKLPPSPFPQQFTLTKANLLPMFARMPLPEAVDLGFRLDADGDAATKTDGEPSASLPKVKVGTTGLTVELQ